MVAKEELLTFVREILDKSKYEDWIITMKASRNRFRIDGRAIEPNAEDLLDAA